MAGSRHLLRFSLITRGKEKDSLEVGRFVERFRTQSALPERSGSGRDALVQRRVSFRLLLAAAAAAAATSTERNPG